MHNQQKTNILVTVGVVALVRRRCVEESCEALPGTLALEGLLQLDPVCLRIGMRHTLAHKEAHMNDAK